MVKPSSKVIASKGKSGGSKASAPVTSVNISNGKTEKSVSVRKIENGFIVSECTYGGPGGYKNVERFTTKAPVIKVDGAKK